MKLIHLLSFLLIAPVFVGCSDDEPEDLDPYSCTCTYFNGTETVTETYDLGPKADQQSATADCDAQAQTLDNLGATSINCVASKVQ